MKTQRLLCTLALLTLAAGAAHAGTVFAVNADTQEIVALDGMTGATLGSVPVPEPASGGPDGLAATDAHLFYVVASGSNMIYDVSPAAGVVQDAFPAPSTVGTTDGLAFDGGSLYSLEPAADTIHRIDMQTGAVTGSCVTGLGAVAGLAAEEGRLFAVAGFTSIAEIDFDACRTVRTLPAPGGEFVTGLAFDGEFLYAGGPINKTVYRMNPDDGAVQGSFAAGFALSGLAAFVPTAIDVIWVDLDVRPDVCPNRLNARSRGVTPVAIHGSETVDVRDIDIGSLRLEGVPALRGHVTQLGMSSDCREPVADEHMDLMLKFDTAALAAAIMAGHEMSDEMEVVLRLEGAMLDGTALAGEDTITLHVAHAEDFGGGSGEQVLRQRSNHDEGGPRHRRGQ